MKQLLNKQIIISFIAITVLSFILPFVLTIFKGGGSAMGVPFVFHQSTSAPPPFDESKFFPEYLLLDILCYYIAAVGIAYLWNKRRAKK